MNTEAKKPKKSKKEIALLVLDVLCIVSGCFFLLMYLPYFFFHVTKGHLLDTVVALAVFVFVLAPLFLRKPLKKLLKKAYLPLKIVWCAAMCFYMISFSAFCVMITGHEDIPVNDSGKQPVVVVFGCQIHTEDWLSLELQSRLDKACEVLKEYKDALCVVSGGKGSNEPVPEADAMKKYLIEKKGIAAERILTEDRSSNTAENVKFTLELLEKIGVGKEDRTFICVSSEFHTPRVYLLCNRAGITQCATVSSTTPLLYNRFVYTVREYMSYAYLLLFGENI